MARGITTVVAVCAALGLAAPAHALTTKVTGSIFAAGTTITNVTGTFEDLGDASRRQGFAIAATAPATASVPNTDVHLSGLRYTSGGDPMQKFIALGRLAAQGSSDLKLGRAIVTYENGRPTFVYLTGLLVGGTFAPLLGRVEMRFVPVRR